jgi:hypothetical protein
VRLEREALLDCCDHSQLLTMAFEEGRNAQCFLSAHPEPNPPKPPEIASSKNIPHPLGSRKAVKNHRSPKALRA